MKRKITYNYLANKTEKRVRAIKTKYSHKISDLRHFLRMSNDFEIPLSEVQENIVKDKIQFYYDQWYKLTYFILWKFEGAKDRTYWFTEEMEENEKVKKILKENIWKRLKTNTKDYSMI